MNDASKVEVFADSATDVLGAVSEGFKLCAECHHFFDPQTRLPADKYKGIYVVRAGGNEICGPCSGEPSQWPGR